MSKLRQLKRKRAASSAKKKGVRKVEVNTDITEVVVSQTIRQSQNYNSAECSYSLKANTSKETLEQDVTNLEEAVEKMIGVKLNEQRELLGAMSSGK